MFMSTATRSLFSLVRSYAILAKDCDHSSFSPKPSLPVCSGGQALSSRVFSHLSVWFIELLPGRFRCVKLGPARVLLFVLCCVFTSLVFATLL